MKKNILSLKIAILSLTMFLIPIVVFGIDSVTSGYRVTSNASNVTISIWDSSCKKVTNSTANNYFIPTKTSAEWTAFSAHLPANVSVGNCTSDCSAGTTNGYTYLSILNGGTLGTSPKAVANGNCSAIASCTSGSITITTEIAACNAGYFDLNTNCTDGCESRCGDGVCNNGETSGTCGNDCGCSPVGSTQVRYALVDQGGGATTCGFYVASETQTCQANGLFTGTYTLTSAPTASTRTAYQSSSVSCGSSCVSQPQTCLLSGWSGAYTNTSCSVDDCVCSSSSSGGYPYSDISYGSSVGVSKTVTNGTCFASANCSSGSVSITSESASCLSGYFDANNNCSDGCESRCGDGVCNNGETTASCSNDCGGCSPSGSTQTRWATLSSACGTYAASETQTCQANGLWTGTYTLTSLPAVTTRVRYGAATSGCGTYGCNSENQSCQSNGTFSGTYTLTSCPATSSRTRYNPYSSSCGVYACAPEVQFCQSSGSWNGSYTWSYCPYDSRTRYAAATSGCGTYSYYAESQYCQSNGSYDGSYTLTSPPSATTRERYSSALTSACGNYGYYNETQTCQSNGSFTGSYTLTSPPPYSTRVMYAAATSACGTYGALSETQYCQSSGGYTGSYTLSSAPSASTRTRYAANTSSCGTSSCVTENQVCQSNGSWSGSYGLTSCTPTTRTMYAASSVVSPATCSSQVQTCQSNGSWSGTYAYGSCSVTSACSCPAGSWVGYSYPAVTCGTGVGLGKTVYGGSCSASLSCPASGSYDFTSLSGQSCNCNSGFYVTMIKTAPADMSCATCNAGDYCTGGNSYTCPANTYSGSGASSCTACPAGTYNSGGGTSVSDCARCGDGTCNSGAGETASSCRADCGYCGDGVCTWSGLYEDCYSCYDDCGGCSCGDQSDCADYYGGSGGSCISSGYTGGSCSGFSAYCAGCPGEQDRYSCDRCGNWTVNYYGYCSCY